jgi:hypothetical protein
MKDRTTTAPVDRRHRRALGRAAQQLHAALRRLKGTGRPELAPLKAAAAEMATGGLDVAEAKRMVVATVPAANAAGVLSLINLNATKEGLDPFEGFRRDAGVAA